MTKNKLGVALGIALLAASAVVVVVRTQSVDTQLALIDARTDMIAARPIGPLAPKDGAACQALAAEWANYERKRTRVHTLCINAMLEKGARPAGPGEGACDFRECLEYHGPGPGSEEVQACYAEVRKYQDRERQDAASEQKRKDEQAKRDAAKKDTPASKPTETTRDTDRDIDRDKAKPSTSDGEKKTLAERLADQRDERRERELERIKAQQKADERAIERATEQSEIAKAELERRTAAREEQKAQLRAGLPQVDARYAAEAGQIAARQAELAARLSDPNARLMADLGYGSAGGSSASDFDFSGIDAQKLLDMAKDAWPFVSSLKDLADRAEALKTQFDDVVSAMNSGPVAANWDRERARLIAKRWDIPEYVAFASLHEPQSVGTPTVRVPEWVTNGVEAFQVGKGMYDLSSGVEATFSSLKDFVAGVTPGERAQGFLNTLQSIPDTVQSAAEYLGRPVPAGALLPVVSVNNAVNALTGVLDEGFTQFKNAVQVFFEGGTTVVMDQGALIRGMFRKTPYVGETISVYESRPWGSSR